MGLEVPRLVQRLRTHFTSPSNDMKQQLTRRTGWTLIWDVKRSLIEVQEGEGGETWTEPVGELSRNVSRDHRSWGPRGLGEDRDWERRLLIHKWRNVYILLKVRRNKRFGLHINYCNFL